MGELPEVEIAGAFGEGIAPFFRAIPAR